MSAAPGQWRLDGTWQGNEDGSILAQPCLGRRPGDRVRVFQATYRRWEFPGGTTERGAGWRGDSDYEFGWGDLLAGGGGGEPGPAGPQGDKGDKGDKGDTVLWERFSQCGPTDPVSARCSSRRHIREGGGSARVVDQLQHWSGEDLRPLKQAPGASGSVTTGLQSPATFVPNTSANGPRPQAQQRVAQDGRQDHRPAVLSAGSVDAATPPRTMRLYDFSGTLLGTTVASTETAGQSGWIEFRARPRTSTPSIKTCGLSSMSPVGRRLPRRRSSPPSTARTSACRPPTRVPSGSSRTSKTLV